MCVPPTTGTSGFTTRFWDCCKPSCAWPGNGPGNAGSNTPVTSCNQQGQSLGSDFTEQSACSNGTAYACFNLAPWAVSDTLAYGFAAFDSGSCGQCYELQFTGQSNNGNDDPGSESLCGKTMIVQVVNIGAIGDNQFDLMIPGGGVGLNTGACPAQWGVPVSQLGATNGGLLLTCQQQSSDYATQLSCTKSACASLFSASNEADLLAGCDWQVDWFGGASNPKVLYQPVTCPSAITAVSGLQ